MTKPITMKTAEQLIHLNKSLIDIRSVKKLLQQDKSLLIDVSSPRGERVVRMSREKPFLTANFHFTTGMPMETVLEAILEHAEEAEVRIEHAIRDLGGEVPPR